MRAIATIGELIKYNQQKVILSRQPTLEHTPLEVSIFESKKIVWKDELIKAVIAYNNFIVDKNLYPISPTMYREKCYFLLMKAITESKYPLDVLPNEVIQFFRYCKQSLLTDFDQISIVDYRCTFCGDKITNHSYHRALFRGCDKHGKLLTCKICNKYYPVHWFKNNDRICDNCDPSVHHTEIELQDIGADNKSRVGAFIVDIEESRVKDNSSPDNSLSSIQNPIQNDFSFMDKDTIGEKKCSCCGEIKVFSEFNKDKYGKFGINSYCKICQRKKERYWYSKNNSITTKQEDTIMSINTIQQLSQEDQFYVDEKMRCLQNLMKEDTARYVRVCAAEMLVTLEKNRNGTPPPKLQTVQENKIQKYAKEFGDSSEDIRRLFSTNESVGKTLNL